MVVDFNLANCLKVAFLVGFGTNTIGFHLEFGFDFDSCNEDEIA